MIIEFGIEISTFFGVLNRVTNVDLSTTTPLISAIVTTSPILYNFMYVRDRPEITFATEPVEPSAKTMPTKALTAVKAGDSAPGK